MNALRAFFFYIIYYKNDKNNITTKIWNKVKKVFPENLVNLPLKNWRFLEFRVNRISMFFV